MTAAVTPSREALVAKLDEIAQFAEANSSAAKNNDRDTWNVHARKVREVIEVLATKPAEEFDPDAMNERRAAEDARLAANVREATIEECAKVSENHTGGLYVVRVNIARDIRALSATGEPKR